MKPIKVSLDDSDIITDIVSKHDIIVNTASSDHPGSIQATLEGIQKRVDAGQSTIYLHTSVRLSDLLQRNLAANRELS